MPSSEAQKQRSSKGGKRAHELGLAHEWDEAEAREAGLKGGAELVRKRGSEYMRKIGKKGGKARRRQIVDSATQDAVE